MAPISPSARGRTHRRAHLTRPSPGGKTDRNAVAQVDCVPRHVRPDDNILRSRGYIYGPGTTERRAPRTSGAEGRTERTGGAGPLRWRTSRHRTEPGSFGLSLVMAATRWQRCLVAVVALLCAALLLAYVAPSWSLLGLRFGHGATTRRVGADPSGDARIAHETDLTPPRADDVPSTAGQRSTTSPSTTTATGAADRQAGWVTAENMAAGTDSWKITARNPNALIEGYARASSVPPGTGVPLYVSTPAPSFVADVYRMGFYSGKQGRLVWSSPSTPGGRQAAPTIDTKTGLVEAHWPSKLSVPVGTDWLPGMYLVKLVSSQGGQSYVPLTVRDDRARVSLLVVGAVATWQAYNQWGGCSLYECHGVKGRSRAVKVSFDRPYARSFNDGSADFLDHELPLVALVEELGIDAGYITSIDLHEQPDLAMRTHAILSLGHDEYYSAPMRQALVDAVSHGVNIAFFGANAIYRHVRFEAAADGVADRVMVNYRNQPDPMRTDPTLEWRLQGKPEASIVGIQYLCAGLDADMVVASSHHWIWAHANVRDGQVLPNLVGNESDGVDPGVSPPNLDLLASSPVHCGKRPTSATVAYHTTLSGAGVFAAGTIWWVCALDAEYCSVPANTTAVRAATTNVLLAFAQGPAGQTHPSGPPP